MQKILVLGAGKSAPYLIHYLLERAEKHDWKVTVGDIDLSAAKQAVAGEDYQWALELTDQLLQLNPESMEVRKLIIGRLKLGLPTLASPRAA